MNKSILISTAILAIAALGIMTQQANSQTVHDAIDEDQVIVCISGHVIGESGNICKVFQIDGNGYFKQEITLNQVQEDLYKNPNSDTFQMDVRD